MTRKRNAQTQQDAEMAYDIYVTDNLERKRLKEATSTATLVAASVTKGSKGPYRVSIVLHDRCANIIPQTVLALVGVLLVFHEIISRQTQMPVCASTCLDLLSRAARALLTARRTHLPGPCAVEQDCTS